MKKINKKENINDTDTYNTQKEAERNIIRNKRGK